jgi:hypothetical protein
MPILSASSAGGAVMAKASVNSAEVWSIAPGATINTSLLTVPGMPILTFLIESASPISVNAIPQVAWRRNTGLDAYTFQPVSPATLVNNAGPFLFSANLPAQAMRLRITNPNGVTTVTVSVVLMASG